MTFDELTDLPVITTYQGKDFDHCLYSYKFLLEEEWGDTKPVAKALQELDAKLNVLYRDDNSDQGGEVVVFYTRGNACPILVYQVGDSWVEQDALFVLDEEAYLEIITTIAKHREKKYKVWGLEQEVPDLYGHEPRIIDGWLWHPRGTPRKFATW